MKWAIELSEFDIRYKPKTAIKGQVLADFVMEFTSAKFSVDGASNAQGSGAGLILTSPEGIDIEYALRFGFQASNIEAVIAGLNLAHSLTLAPRRITRKKTKEIKTQRTQEYNRRIYPKKDARKRLCAKRFKQKTKGEGSSNSLKAKKRSQDQGHTRQRMSAKETEGN